MMIIAAALAILLVLFIVWRARFRYPPRNLPQSLCYHKLSTRFCFEGTWITPSRFLSHLRRLIDDGFEFIDEHEYLEALDRPSHGHAKQLLLTFDDGYEAVHRMFLDHLAPRGIPLLVFLVAGFAGRHNDWDLTLGRRRFRHLSWDEVRQMAAAGASVGSHGLAHVDLTRVSDERARREIVDSKRIIEGEVGVPVRSFSYPFGRYDARVKRHVERAGYRLGFSLYPAHSNERVDRFALRRNGVYVIDGNYSLRCKLQPSPLYWFEEMKCRTINSVAVLTPLLKRPDS